MLLKSEKRNKTLTAFWLSLDSLPEPVKKKQTSDFKGS